mmetsp:Transcript_51672/g.82097  ORF Transcript_51672/g.82097 Transcript_51672/m.82097 type:complete len:379 (-) Transcript_51672:347-1483(-)
MCRFSSEAPRGNIIAPVVCVTGANGFLGSHIVEQLLLAGYRVRGTVRNATDLQKTKHLRKLNGASARLELFSAEMRPENSIGFDVAIEGCSAVIHTASPCNGSSFSNEDVHSAVFGTLAVLRASQRAGVKTVVMTSAMCAASPQLDGAIICETNWADAKTHVENGNKFSASKILSEQAAQELLRMEKPDFRFVAILPSCIVGPSLNDELGFTNSCLLSMMKCGFNGGECPNDSLSFIDVRDCAAHHIAAMELELAEGRYLSAASSMHLNDLAMVLKEINPSIAPIKLCDDPCAPTVIDRTLQDTLKVNTREMPEILCDAAKFFRKTGMKDARNFVEVCPTRCTARRVRFDCSRHSKRSSVLCTNPWAMYTYCDDSHGH